jgi:hypothetical protein
MPSAKYCLIRVVAEIGEGQHDDREARGDSGLGGSHSEGRDRRRQIGDHFGSQRIDPHWPSNVLDALLAQIFEGVGQLVADVVSHCPRNADPARLCEGFDARRDIDAVAEDVAVLDYDVAEIDPDPEPDPVLGRTGFAIDHRPLQFGGAAHRIDDARELHQHAIAGRLDDAAGMFADLRVDELAAVCLEAFVRSFFIRAH